jgi:MFS family permease
VSDAQAERAKPRSSIALRALYVASGVSLLGNQLTSLALPWLVLTTLGSAVDAGLVGAAIVLPGVIGALAGGVVIDRIGPRRTSVLADLTSAVAVAAVPFAAVSIGLNIPLVVVLAFAGALLDAPGYTARQVLIPDLAARSGTSLDRANGTFQAIENGALLLGPAVAGILVATLGSTNALWLDAASFVVSAILIRLLVPAIRAATSEGDQRVDFGAGIRAVFVDPVLRILTIAAAGANFLLTPLFVVVLPVLATADQLGAEALGWMLAAYGGGSVAGALGFARFGGRLGRARLVVAGFVGTGLAIAAGALTGTLQSLILTLGIAGLAAGPINPIAFTVIAERVPAATRGRVFGAVLGTVLVAAPAGMLVAGWLTSVTDARTALGISGSGLAVIGLFLALARSTRGVDDRPVQVSP